MKVFLIAFACEPNRTSEPGVGWHIVGELAKKHELTVLTRCNNRNVIEEYVKQHKNSSLARVRWQYFELEEWFHQLKKRIPCGIKLYQEIWQFWAARKYRNEFSRYAIVHHLTFGSIFFTPWAARYADNFIWGPIGGASGAMETAFLKNEIWHSRISETLYRIVAWYSYHPAPWARSCRRRCRAILFRTSELVRNIPLLAGLLYHLTAEAELAYKLAKRRVKGIFRDVDLEFVKDYYARSDKAVLKKRLLELLPTDVSDELMAMMEGGAGVEAFRKYMETHSPAFRLFDRRWRIQWSATWFISQLRRILDRASRPTECIVYGVSDVTFPHFVFRRELRTKRLGWLTRFTSLSSATLVCVGDGNVGYDCGRGFSSADSDNLREAVYGTKLLF